MGSVTQHVAKLNVQKSQRLDISGVLQRARVDGFEARSRGERGHNGLGLVIVAGGKSRYLATIKIKAIRVDLRKDRVDDDFLMRAMVRPFGLDRLWPALENLSGRKPLGPCVAHGENALPVGSAAVSGALLGRLNRLQAAALRSTGGFALASTRVAGGLRLVRDLPNRCAQEVLAS